MLIDRLPPVASSLRPSNHPYLSGAWTPQHEEVTADDLPVIEGSIPRDIDGVYLRNTENQLHQPLGKYHPFDGDGMIHQIDFARGRASYRNRWVRTRCFAAEQEAGDSLWGGLMDKPGTSKRPGFGAHGSLKDSSSTDIVVHAGKALSTFYQCGEGYQLDPATLAPLGVAPWVPLDGISAHPKVDLRTGELLFFNYSKHTPYMHFGVVDAGEQLVNYMPVPLPGPRLPHDMIFSENWAIVNDLPMFWDIDLLPRGIHAARLHDGLPSRFGLIPRTGPRIGDPAAIRWFDAAPTYILHFLNAYEDGDEVVMDAYFQDNPQPAPLPNEDGYGHMMAYVDEHSFLPRLHRWRFNLADGTTREERLDHRTLEFGMIDQRVAGRRHRYVYSTTTKPGWFLFNGFVKHDLDTRQSWSLTLPEGRFASEAPFVPRIGGTVEDDGYLVSLIIDENTQTSECILIDAHNIEAGPVCRIALPHKISSGTHSCWAERGELKT